MDVCVVFYELRPVDEIHVVIQKKKDIKDYSLPKDQCVRQV